MANIANVTVTITNGAAIKAMAEVGHILRELEDDLPWRDDVKRARERFEFAMQRLTAREN